MSIDLCRAFPDATTLNLGGGYKVGRMAYEKVRTSATTRLPLPR
jgi:diaminopimelate decarboxylase